MIGHFSSPNSLSLLLVDRREGALDEFAAVILLTKTHSKMVQNCINIPNRGNVFP